MWMAIAAPIMLRSADPTGALTLNGSLGFRVRHMEVCTKRYPTLHTQTKPMIAGSIRLHIEQCYRSTGLVMEGTRGSPSPHGRGMLQRTHKKDSNDARHGLADDELRGVEASYGAP